MAHADAACAKDGAVLAVVDAALAAASKVVAELAASPDGVLPPIAAAILRERALANGISHVLFVSIDHAGSFSATPNRSDDDLIWPGGLQVSFLVLDLSAGETVEGGVEQAVTSATFHPKSGDLDRHQVKVINDEPVNT